MPLSNCGVLIILTVPVYKWKLPLDASYRERIEATAGYVSGAFDVGSLPLEEHHEMVMKVYETSNPLVMYGRETQEGDQSFTHVTKLDFGDPFRKHQMTCRYRLHQASMSKTAFNAMCLGYLTIVLVGHVLFARAIHIVDVEEEMQQLKVRAVAKSQFLANVSREINDILDADYLSFPQRDYAQTAQAYCRASVTMVNRLLELAKVEAGSLELELAADKVHGRFRQVFTKLVGNSVEVTEQGHVSLQLRLTLHSKESQSHNTSD